MDVIGANRDGGNPRLSSDSVRSKRYNAWVEKHITPVDRRLRPSVATAVRFIIVSAIVTIGPFCSAVSDAEQPAASPGGSHIIIPMLANASKPTDLDFQAGECDIDAAGTTMECQFQQVFLTVFVASADTCLVTTHRYVMTFQKEGATRWASHAGPEGVCGATEVTTLQSDGPARWTMDTRTVVADKAAAAECRHVDETPEILTWQNVRRALPCKFVQPGAMSR